MESQQNSSYVRKKRKGFGQHMIQNKNHEFVNFCEMSFIRLMVVQFSFNWTDVNSVNRLTVFAE